MIRYHHAHSQQRATLPASTPTHLVQQIRRACADAGLTLSAFGKQAANDSALVPGIIAGRTLRPATLARVKARLNAMAAEREVAVHG